MFQKHPGIRKGTSVASLRYSFRFFTESLATRTARLMHRQIMALGINAQGNFDQQRLVIEFSRHPEIGPILQLIHDRMERFERFEFMGCHVCADPVKQASYNVTGTGGIQVCSRECHESLKRACADKLK